MKKENIVVEGDPIEKAKKVYLAFNKPVGVVTTRSDELGRSTIYNFFPDNKQWFFPVGRLDKDTSGLLLLTNDTRFGDRITNPLSKIPKTYEVRLNKPLTESAWKALENPMTLSDGTALRPASVRLLSLDRISCEVRITEGKNRQIRRMFEQIGYKVIALKRCTIGSVSIGNLAEGKHRLLTLNEIAALR